MPESDDTGIMKDERFIKLLQSCTEVAIEPGLDIAIEVVGTPTHSTIPAPKAFTLSITKKRKLKIEKQWDRAKFIADDDWFGYRWIGHCFMLEDRAGDMLIGDQLPSTEKESRLLCRVANMAIKRGFKECESYLKSISFSKKFVPR